MKRTLAALIFCLPTAGFAQTSETMAAAERYIAMPEIQSMMDEMLGAEAAAANFRNGLPPTIPTTDAQLEEIGALLSSKMQTLRPELEAAMTSGAAKHFTVDEIEALIAFYQSPLGASVMAKMQPYMTETMGEIMPAMMQATQSALPDIQRILTEQ